MKQKNLIIIVLFIVLSMSACSLAGDDVETEEGAGSITTQPSTDSDGVQPSTESDGGQPSSDSDSDLSILPIEIVAEEAPEGYPENEIPIYNPASSVIMGGLRKEYEGILSYNLVIGSSDDMQTVTENIRNTFENESTRFEEVSPGMLIGEKGEWTYTITINAGEADGYKTVITYTLVKL